LTAGDIQEEDQYLPLVRDFLRLSILAAIQIDTCQWVVSVSGSSWPVFYICHTQVRNMMRQSKLLKAWPKASRANGLVLAVDLLKGPRSDEW